MLSWEDSSSKNSLAARQNRSLMNVYNFLLIVVVYTPVLGSDQPALSVKMSRAHPVWHSPYRPSSSSFQYSLLLIVEIAEKHVNRFGKYRRVFINPSIFCWASGGYILQEWTQTMYRLSLPPSPKCRQRGGRNATHTHSIRKKLKKKHTCANQRDWEIQGIEKNRMRGRWETEAHSLSFCKKDRVQEEANDV